MKHLLFLVTFSVSMSGLAQNTSSASEYMSYFSSEYLKIQEYMWDYTRSVSHGRSAKKVEKRRAELIQSTGSALNRANRAKDFKGDGRYRDSVIHYFFLIDVVLQEDYAKILDMEAVSEQSYDAMEAYMLAREMASDKLKEAGEMINREHRLFAESNDITIIENESKLDQKIEIANLVYDHYNEVYLVFFKSYKQESYLLDAISRNDVSAIEQNRNALLDATEEGLTKLSGIKKYEGDPDMITSTRQLLNFYKREAEDDVDAVLHYLETNERFMKIKEAFDQKKPKSRTQEDVDQFNNGVNEMNDAATKYNSNNEASNKKRGELVDNWNKAAEKFTNRHVPKGK